MNGKYAVPAFLDVKSKDGNLNLVLCVVSSAVAGIGIGLFGCLLSAADHIRRRNGGLHTMRSRIYSWIGMVGSVVFGLFSLVGLIFGSVSLATVVRAGSTLPANAVFSQMFGLRPLVRDDVLGTLVTISGIISFTIFQGWSEYKHDEIEFLTKISAPGSIVWMAILFILPTVSSCWLYFHRSSKRDSREYAAAARRRAVAATLICSCSSAFMDLAAKGWSSSSKASAAGPGMSFGLASPTFWTALSLNVLFLILMRWSIIYGCRRCDVLIFVPLNTTANIIFSVAAGMICLSEYKSVKSWPGLVTAGLSMLCGIFMLVTGPAETMASWIVFAFLVSGCLCLLPCRRGSTGVRLVSEPGEVRAFSHLLMCRCGHIRRHPLRKASRTTTLHQTIALNNDLVPPGPIQP
ncbi:NUDT14 [Symbiodinium pilosum]|uniref:NUDT14 protein n=1 Tax=Symbiodinium pilosum TaxID=2952 RepID=A0A812X7T7_SYMPI|nr:NUDT14 [Symbiodinium pilosum]